MVGHPIAIASSMVKIETIEELMGIGDHELPDFNEMILHRDAGGGDGRTFRQDEDRKKVWRNLEPYQKALANSGFTSVLLEIAVIQDLRLVEERRQLQGQADAQTFFVSDVVSFGSHSERSKLLEAWDFAINRLLNEKDVHQSPVPIVTNEKTYLNALYAVNMAQFIEEAEQPGPRGLVVALSPSWIEERPAKDARELERPVSTQKQEAIVPPASTYIPANTERQESRTRYSFAWEEIKNEPDESVRFLLRGFLHYLFSSCEGFASGKEGDAYSRLKKAISESYLLVIPFRRPRVAGTISSESVKRGRDNAEPGGCFFALIRPIPGKGQEMDDQTIRDLTVRLSWLLARSALAEAFSEIALKHDKDYVLSIATHHLPTELRDLEGMVGRSRDELRRQGTLTDSGNKALEYMRSALQTANRLELTAEFLNKAQKARDSGTPQCKFGKKLSEEEFKVELCSILDQTWSEAMEPFLNSERHAGVNLDRTQITAENLNLPALEVFGRELAHIPQRSCNP